MYSSYINALSLFGSYERADISGGFDYSLSHDLPWKFFVGMHVKGVRTDYERSAGVVESENYTRGVKFSNFESSLLNDPATLVMPTLEYTRFVKQAGLGELYLKKQFDLRILFFTFPFSLVREGMYVKQGHYAVQDYGQSTHWSDQTHYNETTLGLDLDVLVLNRLVFPLNFKYIYNDNTLEKHHFRFSLGTFSF